MKYGLSFLLLLLAHLSFSEADELRIARYLSDHSILQRGQPVKFHGFSKAGAELTIKFSDQTKRVTADEKGMWFVELDAMEANENGQELSVNSDQSKKTLTLKNILIGDVFLYAYQTSVDLSLGRHEEGKALAHSVGSTPNFRVIRIKTLPEEHPLNDLSPGSTSGWETVNASSAHFMSEMAFHLGQQLVKNTEVPIGIVDLNMGKSFSMGWMDLESIQTNDDHYGYQTRIPGYSESLLSRREQFKSQAGKTKPEKAHSRDWVDDDPLEHPLFPAAGYNATLSPLKHLTLKAAMVQIGQDYAYLAYEELKNAGHFFDREKLNPAWWTTYLYRKRAYRAGIDVLPRIPSLWRRYLGNMNLPMALVTPPASPIGSYAIHNHEMREIIRQTVNANQNVGIILAGTDHIPFSGQPADQELLASRGLSWLLNSVYQKKEKASSGPWFERVDISFNKAQVFFKEGTAKGLVASGEALKMFEVSAIDAEWYPAKANLDGETVRLISDDVNQIAYVRFNYKQQPDYGLVNSDHLPAMPFRTGDHKWIDVPRDSSTQLPMEYETSADQWESEDVAIISGGGAGYKYGSGLLGQTGLQVKPFGPNMKVVKVLSGSPSDGKVKLGDLIYKVNGRYLETSHLHMVADAIAYAESEAGAGKISFSLRREKELLEVQLQLEVLGTISSTTPYDCPKSERLIKNSEAYLVARDGQSTTRAGGGWLHTDLLFLLATGNPKHLGLIRRFVYEKSVQVVEKGHAKGGWSGGAGAMLLAEYYLATGDKNVLPALKIYCDGIAADQCKEDSFPDLGPREFGGWRHNHPGGRHYGMMATIGYPNMIGWTLARESGVQIDEKAFAIGHHYFTDHQAEMGRNDYAAKAGMALSPEPMDPVKMSNGMISGHNGSRGLAAIYYDLVDNSRIAHLNSLYCCYAFNECNIGHASNFFNGMWTPIGASKQSKAAFSTFMKNHYWFQDLRRMYDHGYAPANGHHLALLVPRKRLQILGAPTSVFSTKAPSILKPALDAHYAKNYNLAKSLAKELLAKGELKSEERGMAEQLVQAIADLNVSLAFDLSKAESFLKKGNYYEASLDLKQLKGVLPSTHEQLLAIEKSVNDPVKKKLISQQQREYRDRMTALRTRDQKSQKSTHSEDVWDSLTTEESISHRNKGIGLVEMGTATLWKAKVVESISQAPKGWTQNDFDDNAWFEGRLPFSWHLNHTLIARAEFNVKDKTAISKLRVSTHPFRQQNIVVYINGKIVAKINQCEGNKGWVRGELKKKALEHLHDGPNTISFRTTNDWRWATRSTPDNGGFGLNLDVQYK